IGIVKKNGIMMVDVALELRRDGMSATDSIHKACLMRFRPIMMTTLAALMGTFPIALGTGASAELRQPLGVAVVGGLLASQALTLFVTPVIYVYMENFSGWLVGLMSKRKSELHVVDVGDQPSLFGTNDDIQGEPQKTAAE
ncbi:MAG: acriflavine resistance protein B, partial [Mesorhizobium sp.]